MSSAERDVAAEVRCPSCGVANPTGARFCHSCGARLDDAGAPREERKLVSVLFVDLVGFTSRSDRADPEDVRDALTLYHGRARQLIENHGGTLEKFAGDAVMAVFGAPVAHGDDAERAVRAGLAVLEGMDELNRAHGLDLAARAAVNTGDAVVSLGDDRAGEAMAIGDVVNTASRLQSAAPPGRLIVGDETYRATRHAINYESLASVEAKGKAEPVPAWLAVEAVVGPADRPIGTTPLVGRDRELELMRSAWARCVGERRPHLITVLGPPGMGKSRLCREVAAHVEADGGGVLRGRCLPYGEQAGYQAFARIVHGASGIAESDSPDVARSKLHAAVDELIPAAERVDTLRYLALLLGISPDDETNQARLLFYAARRFIESVGAAQPTLFVFEDVHWAQRSEIDLLEYLAQHVHDAPVMLVTAARPELLDEHPTWGSGLAARTMIPLGPLPPEDGAALAAQILPAAADEQVARLVEVGGGNPLFLEELAASVVELGDTDDLPVTVREAIAARIDALPAEARSTLLSAAVVGRTFWRGVVEAIGGGNGIDEVLDVLEARDFIRRDPSSELEGDVQFTFRHMLIREVAYSTVPRASRRERHAALARHIEQALAGATDTLATILAYHWGETSEPERAIPYLLAAADAARRSWAQGAVIDLYSRALELAGEGVLRRQIRLERGRALVELADYPTARDELRELLPELEGRQKLDALILLGHATVWTENEVETLETVEAARSLLDEVDDPTALPAVLAMESQGLAMRGQEGDMDRALELGDRALELWVPGTRPLDLRHQLHLHADATYWAGKYERSVELSRQTRAVATEVHSAEALLRGGGFEALALAGLGQHEEAIAIWDEMFDLARELGHSPMVVLNYSALAYRELYDIDEAQRRTEEAFELSAGQAFSMPRQFAGSDLIITSLLAGDIGRAQSDWPLRWQGVEEATGWTTWLIAGRLAAARAEIALQAETADSALEWAQRAVAIARRTRRWKYEARSLTALGEALGRLGRREEALQALRSAVSIADELVGPPARWHARSALGKVSHALGDDETAAAAYAEAAGLVESFAGALAAERKARLMAAAPIEEILSLAGRRPAA